MPGNPRSAPRVLVAGGGMAGFCAALAAQEAGATVTIVEKGPRIGGSAALSSGFVWTHRDDLGVRIPLGNPQLQSVVTSGIESGIEWLRGFGIRVGAEERILDHGRGWRVEMVAGLELLDRTFRQRGGDVLLETSLAGLVRDRQGVVGARLEAQGRRSEASADAVVLATGGFQGNAELMAQHCVPRLSNVYLRANPWSTGDGIVSALAMGGAMSGGLDSFYGHAMLGPPVSFQPVEFGDVTQYYGQRSVALDLAGNRFTDESVGTGEEVLNQALAQQPEGRGVYVVDRAVYEGDALPPGIISTRAIIERALDRDRAVQAASLEELADRVERFDVHGPTALDTLLRHNDDMAAGRPGIPPRTLHRDPVSSPPFYAVAVKAAITFTTGGLAVDERMRVLDRATSSAVNAEIISDLPSFRPTPIGGLLAAGADVGNISNNGYAGGLATAMTTGRLAGVTAAQAGSP